MQSSTAQVKELTAQMNQMRLRQQELEARNGVLEYTCTLATKHIMELNEDPVRISFHSSHCSFLPRLSQSLCDLRVESLH